MNGNHIDTVPQFLNDLPRLDIVHFHDNPVREFHLGLKLSELSLDVFSTLANIRH